VRVYVDSSALIKRSVAEPDSDALDSALDKYVAQEAALVSSALAWIEVSRALRLRLNAENYDDIADAIDVALSGVAERPITADVVSLARRIHPGAELELTESGPPVRLLGRGRRHRSRAGWTGARGR
jgi:hypothetical protein